MKNYIQPIIKIKKFTEDAVRTSLTLVGPGGDVGDDVLSRKQFVGLDAF